MAADSSDPPSGVVLRSDLFEVAPAPPIAGAAPRLPRHVEPAAGEVLFSWVAQLGRELGLPARAFCAHAFGADMTKAPDWWRRPGANLLMRIASRTGLPRQRLQAMTLTGWVTAFGDEDDDRFGAGRWRGRAPGRRHMAICPRCLAEAARPNLQLTWILGWTGVCSRHGIVLERACPSCWKSLRPTNFTATKLSDLFACRRCGASLKSAAAHGAHVRAVELQDALIEGKRTGATALPGLGTLDWRTTIALADVLLAMVWVEGANERRQRLFARIANDLGPTGRDPVTTPWTSNYGGLLILAWLFEDLEARLRAAVAILCGPRLDGLLARVGYIDDDLRGRLAPLLAGAVAKPAKNRRAWRPWIDGLPENAAVLRERATRERYRHRRQRLTAFAELKDGVSIKEAAAKIGVAPKSIYRWLRRGAANGLEAALERPTGKPALCGAQAEALGQWIAADRRRQGRRIVAAKASELFAIDLNLDAASKLLAKHRRAKPGRRRRLWGPKHGPRRKAGSTHDPAPCP
jgi:transposase